MKRIVVMLTFLFLSCSTWAQLPSDCTVPDVLKSNYEFDVADLTFKWLHEIHSPDTSLIEIPQWAQEPIWEGLAAIYNRHDIIEIDSLFNKYCVHNSSANHNLLHHFLLVEIDTSFEWTRNWALLQTTTGIPALDSLLAKYGFAVDRYYAFPWGTTVELTTNQSINILPLCDSLVSFSGIIAAYPEGVIGDGSTIEFEYSDETRFYTFTLAWGDCPSGCTSFHVWKFKVNADCSIDFLGIENYISDSYYPQPKNCNLSDAVPRPSIPQPQVAIFPNPSDKYQTISTNLTGTLSFDLVDEFGQKILSGTFQNKTTLDLRTITHGLYFLIIQNEINTLITKKILIE